MTIQIKSYNEILGDIIRKIIAETALNDINTGSVLLTLAEAAAQSDFENNAAILNILELLSLDVIRNNDLDARAADYGISRKAAQKASGFVKVIDSNITKRSTGLYQVKPAPIAGSTIIYVNNAADFDASGGQIFIGRGTTNFEGPVTYSSIDDNTSFYTIHLSSALKKDHLISDVVVDAQGTTDRLVVSGTTVKIPSSNQNPEVLYRVLRDAIIPAGEDSITNIEVVAKQAGKTSNAGINTITKFDSAPFSGATVTNTTAFTNGSDVETDDELRERIKSYSSTLARGTKQAILAAVIGVSDPDESKQVASAYITEPPNIGDPSILYIDDGTGFQPSTAGQSVDMLLSNAAGTEEFLQLANFPLPRPEVTNTAEGPFILSDGMTMKVLVDGQEESILFESEDFVNITAASVSEVIVAINNQSNAFKARFTTNSSRILLFPVSHNTETIQVAELGSSEDPDLYANDILKFPTNEFSYIRLYKDNILLTERERAATLITNLFSTWNIVSSGNIIISVDGTPSQNQTFTTTDFDGASLISLSLNDWVEALNNKFAGITATATPSGAMKIVSNKEGSDSSLEIIGGSYIDNWFADANTLSVGTNSDFQLNRQNGNLRILTSIEQGETISAGTSDARGNFISTATSSGVYNSSTDGNSRPASLVAVADASVAYNRNITVNSTDTITVSSPVSETMRLMSSALYTFAKSQPGDYVYITSRGGVGGVTEWIHPDNTGLFRIVEKGNHVDVNVDSYIDVKTAETIHAQTHTVFASEDIQIFTADQYPQLWKGTMLTTPASSSVSEVVSSINDNLINVEASVYKTSSVKLSSSTEDDGSIAIPISVGNATTIFPTAQDREIGNPSHIANRKMNKDALSYFKRTSPTNTDAGGVTNRNVWLNRYTYSNIFGPLSDSAIPGIDGIDVYSEEIEASNVLTTANTNYKDLVFFTDGNNKLQYRSIRDILSLDTIGTQHSLPRTIMDHNTGNNLSLAEPLAISPNDSIVFIIDNDAVAKTIDIPMARTGKINNTVAPTNASFSADDMDGEANTTFGSTQVWGTIENNTDFKDYAIWFRARNWYESGGSGSGGGAFIIRSNEYGTHGENYRFQIDYPGAADASNSVTHANFPEYSITTYFFGSDSARSINVVSGSQIVVSDLGSGVFRYQFISAGVDFSSVQVDDIISIRSTSGVSTNNAGVFRIQNVDATDVYVDVYNPNGIPTQKGFPEITNIQTVAEGSQKATAQFTVTDYSLLSGVTININGSYAIEGIAWTAATSNDNTAISIAAAISAFAGVTAQAVGSVVTVTSDSYGTIPNSWIAESDATGGLTDPGTFSGGQGSLLDGKYFILYDELGSVAFWYNVVGASEPLTGAYRAVEIATVVEGDSSDNVASKTAVVINNDSGFASATVNTNTITATDASNGERDDAVASTSGFTISTYQQGIYDSVEVVFYHSQFSIFPLSNKTVAEIVEKVNEGDIIRLAAVGDDSIEINTATRDELYTPTGPGDYSTSLSYSHNPDPGFKEKTSIQCVADSSGSLDGKYFILPDESTTTVAFWYDVNNSGTVEPSHGADRSVEITTINTDDNKFQVAQKTAIAIQADSNFICLNADGVTEDTIEAISSNIGAHSESASAGDTGFTVTQNIAGTDGASGTNEYVSLHDSISWIKSFQNTDPHFNLKQSLVLEEAGSSTYSMGTAPNDDIDELGEQFKLVPVTIDNVYHHFTQKALSQLPIVASVDYTAAKRRIQIKSKKLGSSGAVEMVGGNASSVDYSIFGESQQVTSNGNKYLSLSTSTYPVSLTKGDIVELYNTNETKRLSRLQTSDTINVVSGSSTYMEYRYNFKDTRLSDNVRFTISDVSSANYKQQRITTVKDITNSLHGKYWTLYSANNEKSYYVWYNTSGIAGSGEPALTAFDAGIEIAISTDDTADDIATATFNILNTAPYTSYFSSSLSAPYITITNAATGDADNAADGGLDTNFAFEVLAEGSDYGRGSGIVWRWRCNDGGSFLNITDINNGNVATGPSTYDTGGNAITTRLSYIDISRGDSTTPQEFQLTIASAVQQGDYFYFENQGGSKYAVWYDIDNDATAPTAGPYTSADYQIEVNITAHDTENEILSKTLTQLLTVLGFTDNFISSQDIGANFSSVNAGDLLQVYSGTSFDTTSGNWSHGNMTLDVGDGRISGFPIINVDADNNFIDIVNPRGVAMNNIAIGSGYVNICPTPIIKWNLAHTCKVTVSHIITNGSTGTVYTVTPHALKIGDSITIDDNSSLINGTYSVTDIIDMSQFEINTTVAASTYTGGSLVNDSIVITKYKIEKLGYGNFMKLTYVSGDSPRFIDCGVAVDDVLTIQGDTFRHSNRGTFRVLGVDNTSIIYMNELGFEEINTIIDFNNLETEATWVASSDIVTGTAGTFKNVSIGDWIKKYEDEDDMYVQVTALNDISGTPTTSDLAVKMVLGSAYEGTSAQAKGVVYDQENGVGSGLNLRGYDDISIVEGDSVRIDDYLFVDNITHADWFDNNNSGTFDVVEIGTSYDIGYIENSWKPFIRVSNNNGIDEEDIKISVSTAGFAVFEGRNNRFRSVRKIEHISIDETNSERRTIYVSPDDRAYKYSRANGTKFQSLGKMDYPIGITTGIDGYKYYTGLLRTVQRIIDGYEPDPVAYPGRRAIGGVIETLPPLINSITLSINATTDDGVNLNEISNNIKSAIIDYVNNLGVGEDVIMSEIIVKIMSINGVEAATFSIPSPSVERISISDNEKAFVEPDKISIA